MVENGWWAPHPSGLARAHQNIFLLRHDSTISLPLVASEHARSHTSALSYWGLVRRYWGLVRRQFQSAPLAAVMLLRALQS